MVEHPAGQSDRSTMLKNKAFAIDQIYVPVKRRKTLDPKTVQKIAERALEQDSPDEPGT